MNTCTHIPALLSAEEFTALFTRFKTYQELYETFPDKTEYKNKYTEARNKIVTANLRLVFKLARKFAGKLSYEDLVSSGNFYLIKAVDTYSPDKGEFSTYAITYIKCKFKQEIMNINGVITVPESLLMKKKKFDKTKEKLKNNLNRPVSETEVLEEMGYKHKPRFQQRLNLIHMANNAVQQSIDRENGIVEGEKLCLANIIEDKNSKEPVNILIEQEQMASLRLAIDTVLDDREREVFKRRQNDETLEEIGKSLNLCKERTRQIESKAKKKLQKALA